MIFGFRRKPKKHPMSFFKPSAFVQCHMCPLESKLSVVHTCHNTGEPRKCLPEKRHRAINIKKQSKSIHCNKQVRTLCEN